MPQIIDLTWFTIDKNANTLQIYIFIYIMLLTLFIINTSIVLNRMF